MQLSIIILFILFENSGQKFINLFIICVPFNSFIKEIKIGLIISKNRNLNFAVNKKLIIACMALVP